MGSVQFCSAVWFRNAVAMVSVCICLPSAVFANDQLEMLAKRVGVRILSEGTSEKEVLNFTKSRIPYGKMSESAQQRAAEIVGSVSQYRRMPSLQYRVNPGMYQYLINNPDVAISTWRVMGISKLQMWQTGEFEYEAVAADGSEGIADVLWRDGNQCLFVVQGKYSSPLLPATIHASALVWLQYRFIDATDGTWLVNQQVETFIYFPSAAVDTIARIASRVTNTILDRNVFEVSLYARMMSQAAEKEPAWVEQLAQRMDGVLPQRRMELVQIARGTTPAAGQLLPAARPERNRAASQLPASGEFRNFEYSLHQLNKHVPLVPTEVEHTPSYGKHIGSGNAWMAKPHEYMPEEAQRAIATQKEKTQRALHYNQFYSNPGAKGSPEFVTPSEVPPSLPRSPGSGVAKLMASPVPLVFSKDVSDSRDHGKASSGALSAGASAPVSSAAKASPTQPSRPVGARPVSREKVTSGGSGVQKPAVTIPPLQTGNSQEPVELQILPVDVP